MAKGDRIAVTAPATARVKLRLAALLVSIVQEGGKATDLLDVALQALLVGLTALEWQRSPEGTPPGITKLIRVALAPEAAAPLLLTEGGEKAETPVQRAWRTWRTAYLAAYARPYVDGTMCGRSMVQLAKLAVDACARMDHDDDEDLELLLVHWWRHYLNDPGYSKGAGDPGFLREKSHGIAYFAKGVQTYGTPWDREVKKVMRPALAPAPAVPRQLAARKVTGQTDLFASGAREVAKAARGSGA
jgi:hypothetical protein